MYICNWNLNMNLNPKNISNCKMEKNLYALIVATFQVVSRQLPLIAALYQAHQPLHPLIVAPFQGVWGYNANKFKGFGVVMLIESRGLGV